MGHRHTTRSSVVLLLLATAACNATIAGDGSGDDGADATGGKGPGPRTGGSAGKPPPAEDGLGRLAPDAVAKCGTSIDPGPSHARRLTRREYDNTVADLFGDTSAPARQFPSDERLGNFDNNATALTVSAALAEAYQKAAATVATTALEKNRARLLPCDPSKGDEQACARSFIDAFGRRAYRRPLLDEERSGLLAVWTQGRKTSFDQGVRLVVEAVLQSAPFLYRVELSGAGGSARTVAVDAWELATRLSYFLWATTPDDELLGLAQSGELTKSETFGKQVDRLLGSPRAAAVIGNFHEQWLGLGDVVALSKDAAKFPEWKSNTTGLLKEELRQLTSRVVRDRGTYERLMTTDESVVNGELAKLYGLSGGPGGDAFEPVTEAKGRRAGVLTLGAVLAAGAKPDATSPVLRGVFVREQLLCQHLPSPPMDVDTTLPEVGPNVTNRERLAKHSSTAACSGCHKLIDPLGFPLEHFDAVGKYRDSEAGKPIDASGELVDADVTGKVNGAAELAAMLAKSGEAQRCYVTNWFRYGFGRLEAEVDDCFLHRMDASFKKSGGRVQDLVRAFVDSDAFRTRSVEVSR